MDEVKQLPHVYVKPLGITPKAYQKLSGVFLIGHNCNQLTDF